MLLVQEVRTPSKQSIIKLGGFDSLEATNKNQVRTHFWIHPLSHSKLQLVKVISCEWLNITIINFQRQRFLNSMIFYTNHYPSLQQAVVLSVTKGISLNFSYEKKLMLENIFMKGKKKKKKVEEGRKYPLFWTL